MKAYITPALVMNEVQAQQMLAESLVISDETVDGSQALTKESADWDIWNEE